MAAHTKYISQSPLSVNKQIAQNLMLQQVTINHKPTAAAVTLPALPTGWKREEVMRQNGLSNGKTVITYIS